MVLVSDVLLKVLTECMRKQEGTAQSDSSIYKVLIFNVLLKKDF
jgi:hypothetical protein